MDELQHYLDTQYREDCGRRDDILKMIQCAMPTFTDQFKYNESNGAPDIEKSGWPYEMGETISAYSPATIAMTAAALQRVLNADIPSSIFENCIFENCKAGSEEKQKAVKDVVDKAALLVPLTGKSGQYSSNTYGKDSVFVLSWISDFHYQKTMGGLWTVENSTDMEESLRDLKTQIKSLCDSRIQDILPHVNEPDKIHFYSKVKENNPEYDNEHAFPLLKALQTYDLYVTEEDVSNDLIKIESYLLRKLHHCISLSTFENSQFDAAELVFTLEGYLIVRNLLLGSEHHAQDETASFLCDRAILEKVFSILSEKQELNQYWRPLRPFLTKPQGYALLPISAEIVQSLLRICYRLGPLGDQLFAKYSRIFERYFDWVRSRFTAKNGKYGWSSEHIYRSDVIHIWQSSQILLFLTDYYVFLRKKIAADALKAAHLSVKYPKRPKKQNAKTASSESQSTGHSQTSTSGNTSTENENSAQKTEDFWDTAPFGSKLVHQKIKAMIKESEGENYKIEQSVSFLLYGPPGTGKTFFAEQISELKQWPLLSLSPSDFIADGVDQLENKAKNLFAVLCAQHNLVIIFDEIDRLMLNRDSEDYKDQGDMFQVMVASLLVKFKDLRETPHIIFLICTNYKHRLDPALIRPGRIDRHILVMPPDKAAREKQIRKHLGKIKRSLKERDIKKIAKRTPLFSYTELDLLVDEYLALTDYSQRKLDKLILTHAPTISLSGYLQHIFAKSNTDVAKKDGGEDLQNRALRPMGELPLDEILMTAYTLHEVGKLEQLLKNSSIDRENLRCLVCEKNMPYRDEALRKIEEKFGREVRNKVKEMIDSTILNIEDSQKEAAK